MFIKEDTWSRIRTSDVFQLGWKTSLVPLEELEGIDREKEDCQKFIFILNHLVASALDCYFQH